jgi:hypothetical protein
MATRVGGKGSNRRTRTAKTDKRAEPYRHPEADSPLRPDVGTQAQFRKKKPPVTYRYDSSLSPALDWDGQNPAREEGEAAIRDILDLDASAIDAAKTVDEAKVAARVALARAKDAALKATHDETVWDHLAGTVSAPFEAGEHGQIAVKVIDDRGNELLVVKNLKDAAAAR